MPQLSDVDAIRARIARRAVDREIDTVDVRDAVAVRGSAPATLSDQIEGRAFTDIVRHGKILFARAGKACVLAVHFGMTGGMAVLEPDEDIPEHSRALFRFADGGRLVFDNPRTFGWLELAENMDTYLKENDIGQDALSMSAKQVARIIGGTRGQVKSALMDQSKIAGIGNVYSDEILFLARLRLDAAGKNLSDAQLSRLHHALDAVLRTATDKLAKGATLPEDWLVHRRDTDESCPRCGAIITRERIAGRTARFCPSCQEGGDS